MILNWGFCDGCSCESDVIYCKKCSNSYCANCLEEHEEIELAYDLEGFDDND